MPQNKQTKEGATSLRAPAHAKPQRSNQTRLGMSVAMATANGESGLNIQSPSTKYTSAARLAERASEREMRQGVTDRRAERRQPSSSSHLLMQNPGQDVQTSATPSNSRTRTRHLRGWWCQMRTALIFQILSCKNLNLLKN